MKFLCSFLVLILTSFAQAGVDNNTCRYNNDNECDDGGPNSQYSGCQLGTDLNDCGPRFSGPVIPPISTEYPLNRVKEGARLACKKAFQKNLVSDKKSCRQEVKSFIKDKEKKQKNPFLILSRLYIKNRYGKKGGQSGHGNQQCTQLTIDYNNLRNDYENAQRDWSDERNELQASIEDMSSEITQLVSDNSYLKSELNKYKPNNQHKKFACSAACKSSDGSTSRTHVGFGTGSLRSQALSNAFQNTQSEFSCYYGVTELSCADVTIPRQSYCSAACTKSDGSISTTHLTGASGKSQVEAEYNAMRAAQSKFSCYYGITVTSCESH